MYHYHVQLSYENHENNIIQSWFRLFHHLFKSMFTVAYLPKHYVTSFYL